MVKESVRKVSSMDVDQYLESVLKKYTEVKALFESHVLNLQAAHLIVAMAPPPATPPNPPPVTPSDNEQKKGRIQLYASLSPRM